MFKRKVGHIRAGLGENDNNKGRRRRRKEMKMKQKSGDIRCVQYNLNCHNSNSRRLNRLFIYEKI